MKRSTIIIAGSVSLAAIALGCTAYFAARAQAQQPRPVGNIAPAVTKVGLVDMGLLFGKYEKVKAVKQQFEKEMLPYTAKREELQKCVTGWTTVLNNPKANLTPAQREQGPQAIMECRRQLEDLERDGKKKMVKYMENQMLLICKEVDQAVESQAASRGFHLILAYGEPETALPLPVAMRRKMMPIDQGGTATAFYTNSVDISADVLYMLNSKYAGQNRH